MNKNPEALQRCAWAQHPLAIEYHDREWGVPVHDDGKLFEFLVLDAFQAGLSWLTILKKRERFRQVFDGFDPVKIAGYGEEKIRELLQDPGIIRNRLKIKGTVQNARAFLQLAGKHGGFDSYIWGFVGGRPIVNRFASLKEIPATSPESDRMSKALKKEGFTFVGSTICYAFMQAAGLVNDHEISCFRYHEAGRQ